MKDLTKIESKLLSSELKALNEKLRTIGDDLADAFSKYGCMQTNADEVRQYVLNHAIKSETWNSRQAAIPKINSSTAQLPDVLKEAILTWAVDDFFLKFNDISDKMEE